MDLFSVLWGCNPTMGTRLIYYLTKTLKKMKKILLYLAFMLTVLVADAQDTIIKRDGSELITTVLQVNESFVLFTQTGAPTEAELLNNADIVLLTLDGQWQVVYQKGQPNREIALVNQYLLARATKTGFKPQPPAPLETQPSVQTTQPLPQTPQSGSKLCEKGKKDAVIYYKGQNSGSGGVVVATLLGGPLIGAMATTLINANKPQIPDLNAPNKVLLSYNTYRGCYQDAAFTMKKRKNWRSYGLCIGVYAAVLIALSISQK
jgi:hypothetical protein